MGPGFRRDDAEVVARVVASIITVVVRGLDPRIHLSSKASCEDDGGPGHLARRRASRFCPAMTSKYPVQRPFMSAQQKSSRRFAIRKGGISMERRHFLKLAFGVVAGASALAASANAAPLPPIVADQGLVPPRADHAEPAVVGQDEVDHLKPEQVRWGHHHWHRHWHRRWHHWHRRHWGWHRRHWHRRWHHRHW
jgi:hypothetical protein